MLDKEYYQAQEQLAKSKIENFMRWNPYSVDKWQAHGFPVRLHSLPQLRALINSMHDNRYDRFMNEFGGLDKNEHKTLLSILNEIIRFQKMYFGVSEIILPFDSILAYFSIYKKIISLKPELQSILEIGPGCGLFSFFLKNIPSLQLYCQIEAAESFYLLQHYLNLYVFADLFEQKCFSNTHSGFYYPKWKNKLSGIPRNRGYYTVETIKKKCFQFPWWEIGTLVKETGEFDIITSNANLCEMEPEALNDYLFLIQKKLKPSGYFFVQCFGDQRLVSLSAVLKKLYKTRLAPVFIGDKIHNYPLTLINAVFINDRHPLFPAYYAEKNYFSGFLADPALWNDIFSESARKKKQYYSESDLTRAIGHGVTEAGSFNRRIPFFLNENQQCPEYILSEVGHQRVFIWGANAPSLQYIQHYLPELNVIAFIDNNPQLQGQAIQNIPIISFSAIENFAPVEVIIIAAQSIDSIADQIQQAILCQQTQLFVL
jgi:hypothetical protein